MTDERQAKSLAGFEWKADGAEGEFSARFATFNAIDADGDVTVPGAFIDGKAVLVGTYNHAMEFLPTGKGVVHVDETGARLDGAFNLKTTHGRDTYESVKDAGALMEWSYIYRPTDYSFGEFNGQQVRFLKSIDVWSVDPVLKGAGVGTGTIAIKSVGSFVGHAEAAQAAVDAFVIRAKSLSDLRAKDAKPLSDDARKAVDTLQVALSAALAELSALTDEAPKGINLASAITARAVRHRKSA